MNLEVISLALAVLAVLSLLNGIVGKYYSTKLQKTMTTVLDLNRKLSDENQRLKNELSQFYKHHFKRLEEDADRI